MDEHQTSQSNSNDADIHAADDLSNVSIDIIDLVT